MTNIAELPQLPQAGFYNPCKGSLCIIDPQYAENLCVNPSFEVDTYNWSGGTLSRVQNPWSGANCLRNTAGGTITYGATVPLILTAGSMYALSFYMFAPSTTSSTTVTVTLLDAASAQRAQWTTSLKPQQWTRFTGSTLIAPASASFTFTIAVSAGITIDIDAVQVELDTGYGATTYLDGSLTGFVNEGQVAVEQYSWSGVPHQSISNRATTVSSGGRIIDLSARYGWNLIGVMNADNPAPNNQTVIYGGSDGASLQDIIIPKRTVQFIGRMSASTQQELAQKISLFQSHFARDRVAYRQQRAFIFQHSDGDDYIGIPMTFSGVIENAMQIPLSNVYETQFVIQISMLDPFFYGHDKSRIGDNATQTITTNSFIYAPNYTIRNDSSVADGAFHKVVGTCVSDIDAIAEAYDGRIFFAGNFLNVGGTSYAYIAVFNPATNTVSGIGTTPSTVFNGRIRALHTTIDRKGLYIGGDFTTANGITANRIAFYNIVANTFHSVGSTGANVGVNNSVHTITSSQDTGVLISGVIHPKRVFIGGTFTANGSGTLLLYRLCMFVPSSLFNTTLLALGNYTGFNNPVYALAWNRNTNYLYVGGSFDTLQGGVAGAYPNICSIQIDTSVLIGYEVLLSALSSGFANEVRTIYLDISNNLIYVGGRFLATTTGIPTYNIAVYQSGLFRQVDTGLGNGTTLYTTRCITSYRNGLIIASAAGLYLFNGQILLQYPIQTTTVGGYIVAFESSSGYLYLGATGTVSSNTQSNSDLMVIDSDSTANSSTKILMINNSTTTIFDLSLSYVSNETQQTAVSLNVNCNITDIISVDFSTGTIDSNALGSINGFTYGAGITTFRVVPGRNFIQVKFANGETNRNVYLVWRQTFNSIFDGIRVQ